MSERDGYQPGVPCWVDTWQPDPEPAARFYAELLRWDVEETTPPDSPRRHFMCRLRGRDVAGVGGPAPAPAPAWTTYVWVESAEEIAARAAAAGGSVVMEPFDMLDGGRGALLADPAGAVFGVWQPGRHRGAQLVNEPGAWSMSLLNTSYPERAAVFYGAVFGWKAEGLGDISLFRLPGYVGGEPQQPVPRDVIAVMAPPYEGVAPQWTNDFWVDDTDATASRAASLGGAVIVAPYDTPFSRNALLADPQGAIFSVSKVGPKA